MQSICFEDGEKQVQVDEHAALQCNPPVRRWVLKNSSVLRMKENY